MTDSRYDFLMHEGGDLTKEEVEEGWHFCWEFDGLLRNNNEEEFKCACFDLEHSVPKADTP